MAQRSCLGSLVKGVFAVVLLAVAGVAVIVWTSENPKIVTTTPPTQPLPRKVVKPTPTDPTPVVQTTLPAVAVDAPVETQPTPPAEPTVDDAQKALESAKAMALKRLRETDSYKALSADASTLLKKLESLRAANDMNGRFEASAAYVAAAAKVKKLETDALSKDTALSNAVKSLQVATKREEERAAAEAAKRSEEERAAARRSAQAAYEAANDPMNIAISNHELVRGMTWSQAIRSLGEPYSRTDAGFFQSATWQYGNGNYWSAEFVNGKITVVTHTKL